LGYCQFAKEKEEEVSEQTIVKRDQSTYHKSRREALKQASLCQNCGKRPARDGFVHCSECAQKFNKRSIKDREKLKLEVFAAYGNSCVCCGEDNLLFLTLDHVNDDGSKHRNEIGGHARTYRWARQNNYPETLQILCANCNQGKKLNGGVCPHKNPKT
jgi:hypothetical protein